jgi:hypothetical protein
MFRLPFASSFGLAARLLNSKLSVIFSIRLSLPLTEGKLSPADVVSNTQVLSFA